MTIILFIDLGPGLVHQQNLSWGSLKPTVWNHLKSHLLTLPVPWLGFFCQEVLP